MKNDKTQIIEHEGKKYKVIEVIEDNFVEIPELKIKVTKETVNMTYLEAEEFCNKNNCKMLNVVQAGFIYDNQLIKNFCTEREWLEHYSQRTRKKGYGCSALVRDLVDDRLVVDGYYWDVNYHGHSFGVRFVYPLTEENKK